MFYGRRTFMTGALEHVSNRSAEHVEIALRTRSAQSSLPQDCSIVAQRSIDSEQLSHQLSDTGDRLASKSSLGRTLSLETDEDQLSETY